MNKYLQAILNAFSAQRGCPGKKKISFIFRSNSTGTKINENIGLLWAVIIIATVVTMICHPQDVFIGAVKGMETLSIIIPSLLPFFIISELLLNSGIVKLLGALLEPLMRPLFNLPGCSSFVLAVGFTSGSPIGSVMTGKLREQRLCTRLEAERLISFTNNASPLFMLAAVSVGMLGLQQMGIYIAAAHYLANLTIGIFLRFYKKNDPENNNFRASAGQTDLRRAWSDFILLNRSAGHDLGSLLGTAVKNSIFTMFNICGFIIIFAVLIRLFTTLGIISLLSSFLSFFLSPLGLEGSVITAIASGIFEMTIGCKLACEAAAPLLQQLIAISIIIAWSGLSVQAQAASFVSHTDIKMKMFCLCRILQAALSVTYLLLFSRLSSFQQAAAAVPAAAINAEDADFLSLLFGGLQQSLVFFAIIIFVLLVLGLAINVIIKRR